MHTVAVTGLGGGNDRLDVQVGADRVGRSAGDLPRRTRQLGVQRQAIDSRVNPDRLNTQRRSGTRDPNRYFAAIGDQHSLEHSCLLSGFQSIRDRVATSCVDPVRGHVVVDDSEILISVAPVDQILYPRCDMGQVAAH